MGVAAGVRPARARPAVMGARTAVTPVLLLLLLPLLPLLLLLLLLFASLPALPDAAADFEVDGSTVTAAAAAAAVLKAPRAPMLLS